MPNDTRTIDLVINNLTEEQFENVFSPDANELWLTPDDTPEQLAEKVDKTSEANKTYGTDAQGNQITYSTPTIPTVNDATLTIQKNGTTVNTFTANASSNVTANITVPTDTNDLTNGAGYITGINSTDVTNALGYTPVDPSNLATVATTGDYDDLLNKPTIPAAQVNSDWNAVSGVAQILNKPTIPTVNDATISVTQNGVSVGSFTLNQASGDTIALTDTTYSVMTGATAGDAGTSGLVPAPAAGDQAKFLQGDGTWANPTAATAWGNITGTLSDQTDLQNALNAKQDALTAGSNINISGSTISATDTTYTGSDGITLTGTNFTNSGVRAVASGTANGTISVNTNGTSTDVAVNGWSNKADAATTLAGYGITDGVTKGHELVAFQFPTGTNKLWYRKYADGWVEQGGMGSASTTGGAVTFPVVMDSTNYVHQVTNAGAQYASTGFCAGDHTTTGMKLYCSYAQGRNAYWEIKGKAAS